MSIHTLSINCSNDDCEEEIEFEVEYDSGEKASWGYSGGSPYIPPSLGLVADVIKCPHCGCDNTKRAEQRVEDTPFSEIFPERDPDD